MTPAPRFRSVILDVDSTLSSIEGIDWLAAQRGPAVEARVAKVTEQAMAGEIPLEAVYASRLELVAPDADLIHRLGEAYVETIAQGAAEAVRALRDAGVELAIVSGGIRRAILPAAERLGIPPERVHAVDVYLDEDGAYSTFDDASPLATQQGKAAVARALALPGPVLSVGDGATDLAIRPAVDAFAAYVGFVRREPVVAGADHVIESFDQLRSLVLP